MQKQADEIVRLFFVYQNHTLDVWFGKNYIVEQKKKPPVRIELRSANCNLEKQEGQSWE